MLQRHGFLTVAAIVSLILVLWFSSSRWAGDRPAPDVPSAPQPAPARAFVDAQLPVRSMGEPDETSAQGLARVRAAEALERASPAPVADRGVQFAEGILRELDRAELSWQHGVQSALDLDGALRNAESNPESVRIEDLDEAARHELSILLQAENEKVQREATEYHRVRWRSTISKLTRGDFEEPDGGDPAEQMARITARLELGFDGQSGLNVVVGGVPANQDGPNRLVWWTRGDGSGLIEQFDRRDAARSSRLRAIREFLSQRAGKR